MKTGHEMKQNKWDASFSDIPSTLRRSQWPRGLRLRSSAAHLLRLWVRIPPGAWIFVCCECFILSGRGLCDGLITRPEESYRLWCVVVCDQETSKTRRLKPATGLWKYNQNGCNARKTNFLHYVTRLTNKFCTALQNGNGCTVTFLSNKICVFSQTWQTNTVRSKTAVPINF